VTPSAALSSAAMHRQALERAAPPSILVDHAQRVVHLSEHAGRYLQPSGGPLIGDAVDLVRQECTAPSNKPNLRSPRRCW
jgi:two-component system CheB/CheR fusion protein